MIIENVEFENVFRFFEEVSNIPRGSKNNKQISDYLVNFAKEYNLSYIQDQFLNVIIVKEATIGYETCPTLILQGHMDMVCEKESDINHNFKESGLNLKVEDDFIFAKGTTLGGDDGIALAYSLAILSDDSIIHPRLEVVITTDEEIGMLGAKELDASGLKGTYMVNIDSGEEGSILVSCAGGLRGNCKIPLQYKLKDGKLLKISLKGLQGGHSGTEIDKNRTNANVLLGRLLSELKNQEFSITNMHGGLKDNAIPREATGELVIDPESIYDLINEIKFLIERYKSELKSSEPNLTISIEQGEEKRYKVLEEASSKKIIFMLLEGPNGVQVMSSDISGLVESSLNLGIFNFEDDMAVFSYAIRSSVNSYKKFLSHKLEILATWLGGTYHIEGDYPGWELKKESKLRDISSWVFKEEYGYKPKIEAIHAGLECGILSDKFKNIDIISIGPNMFDIHTPQEKLSISSSVRVYSYLLKLLETFAKSTK